MTAKPKSVRIIAQQDNPTLSKGQKTFNTLVEKIALRREQLTQWQTTERACVQKVASDFMPLMQSFHTAGQLCAGLGPGDGQAGPDQSRAPDGA
ncbi:MAG: hypothetical protein V4858_28825 [Pseudomonadota bacterium]